MGKSYDLEDSILYRIMDEESTKKDTETQTDKKRIESWLMSNIFRYVENPEKHKDPTKKYTGQVRFRKMKEDSHGELVEWNVGEPNENVTDIEIIVFEDDMKTPR